MEDYFRDLEEKLNLAYETARKARSVGFDPVESPEIPLAEDLAERVEKLAGPEGVAEYIRDLEDDYSREDIAFKISGMIVGDEFGHLSDREAAEQAIRTCLAIITEGTAAAAPIEGITKVDIRKNFDGSSYLAIYFAGPIRAAGGTALALAVLTGDFVRRKLNLSPYAPSDQEVERAVEEVNIYDASTGLQYSPSEDEVRSAYRNIPIEITGEPTEQETVTGYRDLDRIETNRVRGGAVLAIAEGVLQKAPKILKHLENLGLSGWEWLEDLGKSSSSEDEEEDEYPKGDKYLRDIIAGRAVFSHPSRPGGFRLRYGRSMDTGLAAGGIHPATMRILDDHISVGTQLKTERPGKATAVAPVDSLEGPLVKLDDGSVIRISSPDRAIELKGRVEEILSLGDILFGYGEFQENNHPLMPAGYCQEWWSEEVRVAALNRTGKPEGDLTSYLEPPFRSPTPEVALKISRELDVPLHPDFTYTYHDLTVEEVEALGRWLVTGKPRFSEGILKELRIGMESGPKRILEILEVPHEVEDGEVIIGRAALPLCDSMGLLDSDNLSLGRLNSVLRENRDRGTMEIMRKLAGFPLREKAPTRIGARMGRPEKNKPRKMRPPPHVLFPIGLAGGNSRNISKAISKGTIKVETAYCECPECGENTILRKCPSCGVRTEILRYCPNCDRPSEREECLACGIDTVPYKENEVDLESILKESLGRLDESLPEILKGVRGMTSAYKIPEPLEKGILRAKNDVFVFKDGTVRFDATDMPLTHFRPREVETPIETLWELGYEEDHEGNSLEDENQIVELKAQDLLLSKSGSDYLLRTAQFVDELLEKFYGLEPFYKATEKEDLVGHLVIGLAPHISAGITGRIIGFTKANVGYAHPYFHAAKRRNCFHPETEIVYKRSSGKLCREDISKFVEDHLDDPRTDDFGAVYDDLTDEVEVPSVDDSGNIVLRPIESVSKHPSHDHLVRIRTARGFEVTVTPDHSVPRWNGGYEKVEARDLDEGDFVLSMDKDSPAGGVEARLFSGKESSFDDYENIALDRVVDLKILKSEVDYTYSVTVSDTHNLVAGGIFTGQCDGDEDALMLLLDALLNFSEFYLPESRGGSVTEDSTLLTLDPEGKIQFLSFDEFWNSLGGETLQDGRFERKLCRDEGWKTYVFGDDCRSSLRPIERAIRYGSEGPLLKVSTQLGRHITITKNHSLFRYDGSLEEVPGEELKVGDLIVAPCKLDLESRRWKVDLVSFVEDPLVLVNEEIGENLKNISENSRGSVGGDPIFDWKGGTNFSDGRVSYASLKELVEREELDIDLEEVRICSDGPDRGVNRIFEIDEDVGWIIGFVLAGFEGMGDDFTLSPLSRDIAGRISDIFSSKLGCELEVRGSDDFSTIDIPELFYDHICEMGISSGDCGSAGQLHIPESILSSPLGVVASFIDGFRRGKENSFEESHEEEGHIWTGSGLIKEGVTFLLHRLGVPPEVSELPSDRGVIYSIDVSMLGEVRGEVIDDTEDASANGSTGDLGRKGPSLINNLEEEERPAIEGHLSYLRVTDIEEVDYDGYLYDLQVGGKPIFLTNWIYAHNSMDAPLVLTPKLNPSEIDDEAHNLDVDSSYPLEFYEATLRFEDPNALADRINLVGGLLGTEGEYKDIHFARSHDTSSISAGPKACKYKSLGSMEEKTESQLKLARKIRAVDESDVAERLIENHFIPDLKGNLRAFSRQKFRCTSCNTKFRRVPLSGKCDNCGGNLILTVTKGGVKKYMEVATRVAEDYAATDYTKQRLKLTNKEINSVFESDIKEQLSLSDFI